MRIMIDVECRTCGWTIPDVLVDRDNPEYSSCSQCKTLMTRKMTAPHVHGDDIPGGMLIEHGLCNADGSPRRYYSKSEMALEAKRRGLVNLVEHKTDKGTDKSPNTQRFV